jgi:hypothetical protein
VDVASPQLVAWDQPEVGIPLSYRVGDWYHKADVEVLERDHMFVRNALPMLGELVQVYATEDQVSESEVQVKRAIARHVQREEIVV